MFKKKKQTDEATVLSLCRHSVSVTSLGCAVTIEVAGYLVHVLLFDGHDYVH